MTANRSEGRLRAKANLAGLRQALERIGARDAPEQVHPYAGHVLLAVDGDVLELCIYDDAYVAHTSCGVEGDDDGGIAVPHRRLLEVLTCMNAEHVGISGDAATLMLRAGSSVARLQGLSAGDFPARPIFPRRPVRLTSSDLLTVVSAVTWAMGPLEGQPLACIWVRADGTKLEARSTNGRSFAVASRIARTPSGEWTLGSRIAKKLASLPTRSDQLLQVGTDDTRVYLRFPDVEFAALRMHGVVPAAVLDLPETSALPVLTFSRTETLDALDLVASINAEPARVDTAVFLKGQARELQLRSTGDAYGSAVAKVRLGEDGRGVKSAVGIESLRNALRNQAGAEVSMVVHNGLVLSSAGEIETTSWIVGQDVADGP